MDYYLSLLTAKSVYLVVAHDGFLVTEIVCIFDSDYEKYG